MNKLTEKANVYSEYGKLEAVFLHYPGSEFHNIDPHFLSEFLLDDTPFLKVMQQEYLQIINLFKEHNVKIFFVEKLIYEVFQQE